MPTLTRAFAVGLTAVGLTLPMTLLPAAQADPANKVVAGNGAPGQIRWEQLGVSERLDLLGENQPFDVSIPVPDGVRPTTLTGQAGAVVNVADGRVEVLDGRDTILGSFPVPREAESRPFTVNISAAQVVDGSATLRFVLRDRGPVGDSCSQPPSLSLTQLGNSFSGPTPNPRTVADFLPGYLDKIVIRVGAKPSPAEQQAALTLVAELTDLYRPMPVRIDVDTSEAPLSPAAAGRRVIEIDEGGPAAMTVEKPGTPGAVLAIRGSGDDLVRQVDLFADRRYTLAQSNSATTRFVEPNRTEATDIKTFAQLGMTGEASVLGTSTLYAGFDVAKFAVGPITNASVHLKARYTPVVGGEASVLIRSGSTVLATRRLDESGVLDLTGDIPAESVTSNIGMALELRYVPSHECAPLNDRMTFALDPQSTVTVTPGSRNRGGFPVLPVAFTPDFDVAIDTPGHLRFAAQAINLMGQQTTETLRPRLTSFDVAAASGTGLLVVGGGKELLDAGMTPALLPDAPNTYSINGSPLTEVDLRGPLGAVQVFTHNNRTVLAVTGTGDWALVDNTFDHIRGLPNRWASLTGDLVATGAAQQTVNLTVREGGALVNEYPGNQWKWWAVLSSAIGVAVAIAAVAIVLVRRRRRAR
ncbi:hypothetical protein [Mycobacterium sp. GA-2829]|uniref:hypothetical protein n=1 Tax=Mycobacterium sp. GA-2829 TaxID=1772283 RepID=UPI000740111D|nr:hypothetical protein [Mycobacterium sp. GA-2829]KUI23686.1 hypothetical protein AU194_02200 [Mycobacterium sp. GA-2829]